MDFFVVLSATDVIPGVMSALSALRNSPSIQNVRK